MLPSKLAYLHSLHTKLGTYGIIKLFWFKYVHIAPQHFKPSTKKKIAGLFSAYSFINNRMIGEAIAPEKLTEKIINWIIPDFNVGSGGHLNIFRLISYLENKGYCNRITIVGPTHFRSGKEARKAIRKHFYQINADVTLGESSLRPAKITVATSWMTAYTVRNFMPTQYRCYFVQDYEPDFYPRGSNYYFAEETYRMGFLGISSGDWLSEKLAIDHGMKVIPMGFSFDHNLYYPRPRRKSNTQKVLFYARSTTPRRGFELGILALNIVAQSKPNIEFVFAGWNSNSYKVPFKYENAGNVPIKHLPDLYSQCDAALVLSFTNLSLLPLELMACGCPVVSNKGDNVEWLLNATNSILVDACPEAISDAITDLLNNANKRKRLIESAYKFAHSTSWELESDKIVSLLDKIGSTEKNNLGTTVDKPTI